METKHKCKLCIKSFSNGRALGGHMRSHMMNLPIPLKPTRPHHDDDVHQLGEETESASLSSAASSSEEEQTLPSPAEVAATDDDDDDEDDNEEEDKGLYYGLRENPKRSFRLADPEFSFAASVVLQDRESETESSKNPTRRRSKRTRKSADAAHPIHQHAHSHFKPSRTESWLVEPEPVSSISDATTEEDVAFCLMMLSRDQWSTRNYYQHQHQPPQKQKQKQQRVDSDELELGYQTQHRLEAEEDDDEEEETDGFESDEAARSIKVHKSGRGGKYKCETCKKLFRSYQALGGHRASHKKLKLCSDPSRRQAPSSANAAGEPKSHECPVCFRVFASGQALGGHKRSHLVHSSSAAPPAAAPVSAAQSKSSGRCGDNLSLIDLNLPAPMDDDDLSQVELSAVSDAEFVNSFRR